VSRGIDWDIGEYTQVSLVSTMDDRAGLMWMGLIRIFTIPKLGEKLKQDTLPLTYTPRKFITHPYGTVFYMIETDHRILGPKTVARIVAEKVSCILR
jgi:hypothetical protein